MNVVDYHTVCCPQLLYTLWKVAPTVHSIPAAIWRQQGTCYKYAASAWRSAMWERSDIICSPWLKYAHQTGQLNLDKQQRFAHTWWLLMMVYLEQDSHGAAGVSRVKLQQLLLRTFGTGGEGAAITHISSLTLEQHTHTQTGFILIWYETFLHSWHPRKTTCWSM